MKIANFKHEIGEAVPVGKWLFAIEILKCPPSMCRVFKPYISLIFTKIIEAGEPWKIDGKPQIKKGGWWSWTCPKGISIKII